MLLHNAHIAEYINESRQVLLVRAPFLASLHLETCSFCSCFDTQIRIHSLWPCKIQLGLESENSSSKGNL